MRLLGIKIEEFRSVRDQYLPADGLVILSTGQRPGYTDNPFRPR